MVEQTYKDMCRSVSPVEIGIKRKLHTIDQKMNECPSSVAMQACDLWLLSWREILLQLHVKHTHTLRHPTVSRMVAFMFSNTQTHSLLVVQ